MSAPAGKTSTLDVNSIKDYYKKRVDVVSRIKEDNTPAKQLDSLKLDDTKDTPRTAQQAQQ